MCVVRPLLADAENFTVLIKNFIKFPKFNVKRYSTVDQLKLM